jgi:homoserine kinase type II
MSTDSAPELREVLSHYELGTLLASVRDERGTVNTSFFIDLQKDGAPSRYFLRRYKPGIRPEEIVFEHALIDHLTARGSCPVARIRRTRSGASFLKLGASASEAAFYAIFDYLPGEDRYTWVGPRCSRRELRASGRLLAQFHSDLATFAPPGRRAEPKIIELLDVIAGAWSECRARTTGTSFDRYVAAHFDEVRESIAGTSEVLRRAAGSLPETIIHSDYHPGNLKFEGQRISGLVDFDWAKVDLRAFDVGLALWYFCTSWERGADGRLRLEATRAFLEGYQERLLEPAEIAPLSAAEIELLPHLVQAGNLYVLYWSLRDYLGKPVDPQEYLIYLRHSTSFARWFNRPASRRRMASLLQGLPRVGDPNGVRGVAPPGGGRVAELDP